MTKKKATVILEGNSVAIEQAIHEISKLKDQADKQPELTASMQTESLSNETYNGELEWQCCNYPTERIFTPSRLTKPQRRQSTTGRNTNELWKSHSGMFVLRPAVYE